MCARRRPGERGPRCRPTAHSRVACTVGCLRARPVDAMCRHRNRLPDTMTPNGSRDANREYTAFRISLATTVETDAHRHASCGSAPMHGFILVPRIGKAFPPPPQVRASMATQHTSIYSKYAIDLGLCTNLSAAAERVALAVFDRSSRTRRTGESRRSCPCPTGMPDTAVAHALPGAPPALRERSGCALRVRPRIFAVRCHHPPVLRGTCEHCIGVRSEQMERRIERASAHPCCLLILHHPDAGRLGFPPWRK